MATVSVNPPKTPVTKGSMGVAAATVPNVCKMPGPPAPFVPTPLPNIGMSGDKPQGYSTKVKIEGQPVAIQGASFGSMGDMASKGTGGGVVSMNTHGPTTFVGPGSLDVQIEGKRVQLLGDPMLNNCGPSGSPANSATMAGLLQSPLMQAVMYPEQTGGNTACDGQHSHSWQIVPAKGKEKLRNKIASSKANRRKGIQFEGAAAEHNRASGDLKRSEQMSGSSNDEKVWWKCSVCGLAREGDQLHDGLTPGSPPRAVEVKNKLELSPDDARQLGRNLQAVRQGAASGVIYKIPSSGAEKLAWQLRALSKKIGTPLTIVHI